MPELAEVEFFRRRWWEGGALKIATRARVQPQSRVFRGLGAELAGGAAALAGMLKDARLVESGTHGKQMWFEWTLPGKNKTVLTRRLWLGVHLGMTGALRVEPADYRPRKHDALVIGVGDCALVFNDPRQFGRVRAWIGAGNEKPPWLCHLPAEVLSPEFTVQRLRTCLARHARAPLKAVLLDQKYFPGIGNWMADEILWRAALHPALPTAKAANPKIARRLYRTLRQVARDALRVIAGTGGTLPPDLNVHIPDSWLFNHRWGNGGLCPRMGKPLRRTEIGGRTTCWSPARQRLRLGIAQAR
jgi:formamidopyrimidine-DNA glycosylase